MKRAFSFLLALCLLLGCLPMAASAAEVTVKEVGPYKYDAAYDFSEGLAAVELDGKYGFIDKTGREVVLCQYDKLCAFSEGLAMVEKDGKWGFIDKTGKEVTPFKYDNPGYGDYVPYYHDHYYPWYEGLQKVESDGKYGFIDKTGKEIVPCKYDEVHIFGSDDVLEVQLDGKWGFFDKTGKEVAPCKYDRVYSFSEDLAAVCIGEYPNEKWGFIDKTDQEVIPCKYDYAHPFYEGLAAVKLNGKWGFIDKTGKEAIPFQYSDADNFSEGLALVQFGNRWGYIDKTGQEVLSLKYDYACSFSEGLANVHMQDSNGDWKYGFIDKTGQEVVPCKYDLSQAWFSEGIAYVELNGKRGYVDKTGKEIIPCMYDEAVELSDGLIQVKLEGESDSFLDDKYGLIDQTGRELVPCKYRFPASFSEGLAAVELNGKWGFIDKTGNEVVPCKYVWAEDFSEGLAAVVLSNGKLGYIDKTGKEVIPHNYDYVSFAGSFSNGLAPVCLDGKWGFISVEYGDSQPENPEKPTVGGFQDVSQDDYYASAVVWAVENRITAGTSDSTFSPNDTCSRAQIVSFLWRAAGRPEPTNTAISFTDVQPGSYYEKAVQWAVENRITAGTSDTTFSPNDTCTRGQIVSFLWRAHGRLSPTNTSTSFRDVQSGAYYEKAVQWAVENRVTAGTSDTTFSPNDTCVRAQGVAFLWRAAGRPE